MYIVKRLILLWCAVILVFIINASRSTVVSAPPAALKTAGGLVISELVSSNSKSLTDDFLGSPDWIELYNASENEIDLQGYSIATSRKDKDKFALPEMKLEAGKCVLLYCCPAPQGQQTDKICTGFKLSKSGCNLFLSSPSGIAQELAVPELETDVSYGLGTNGKYGYFTNPTPGTANGLDSVETLSQTVSDANAALRIQEVLPRNNSGSDSAAWVELYNGGKEALELSDYCITDNLTDLTKARLPEKSLKPGEYAVFRLTGGSGADELPFKLGGTEKALAIGNNTGMQVDSLTWDAGILPGISVGRTEDGKTAYFSTPTPGAKKGGDTDTDADFSMKEGVPQVRINEILMDNAYSLIDEDGDRSSWVELYNASDSAVSLNGYALSDEKDDLWKWSLPDIKIDPNGYAIVYLSGKDRRSGTSLHASFRLGSADKCLTLSSSRDKTTQTVNIPEKRDKNVSCGMDEKGDWLFYPMPTPGKENTTQGFKDIAEAAANGISALRINEVSAAKSVKSTAKDWVEIYNPSLADVDLSGFYLSDTFDNLKKWKINNAKAKTKGYAVIDAKNSSKTLNISAGGERLYLADPSGNVIDEYDTGVLRPGLTSGLVSTGSGLQRTLFKNATKGKANGKPEYSGYAAAPVFSEEGGYKSSSFELEMTTATEGGAVYYTTDGSAPSKSSKKYTGPIQISSNKTVRAVTIAGGKVKSDETVATYLFGVKHSLPVICISMSQGDLSYVFRSTKRDDKKERGGYVEYYESDGTLGTRFPAGFHLAGNGTRTLPQKSINIYLRGGYGQSSVTYPFFGDYPNTTFKSLSLRNNGQDRDKADMRDVYLGMIAKGMNVDYMEGRFAVLYINGKYNGLYEFKENQNEDFLASRHNIDPNKVEVIRGNTNAVAGSSRNIKSLFAMAKRNTANAGVFKQYTEKADADYFMDYLIAQTFFGNADFYNQKYAHSTDDKMKWRPLLYDLDMGMRSAGRNVFNNFFSASGMILHADRAKPTADTKNNNDANNNDNNGGQVKAPTKVETILFYAFKRNKAWSERFVERYAEVLNTILTEEKMLKTFDDMVDSMKGEMQRHIKRWHTPSSMSAWNSQVKSLRKIIISRRKNVLGQLKSCFHLSGGDMKRLFPNDY
jgi:hypothetical protein